MPKVSEEYLMEKRKAILDCARDLIKEMPLYTITMRDLINRLGFSQGVIYRYYKSTDEIFVDLMNREIEDIEVMKYLDEILEKKLSFEESIHQMFECFAHYVYKVQNAIGGKLYYEIQVGYMFDYEKQQRLLSQMIYKKNLERIQEKLTLYIVAKIEKEGFVLKYPMTEFVEYICATIDGICNDHAVWLEMGKTKGKEIIKAQFRMLADYCLLCVGERKN